MKQLNAFPSSQLVCLFIFISWMVAPVYGEEPAYTTIAVDELDGLERPTWPIHVGVPVYGQFPVDQLRLFRVGDEGASEPIPFQVIEIYAPDESIDMTSRRIIRMVDLVFITSLAADEEARFRLYYGEGADDLPEAPIAQSLQVEEGEHLARNVDTGPARFGFHDLSGQLLDYSFAANGERVHFTVPGRKRPIHHNPDAWVLPKKWTHASGWDVTEPDTTPVVTEINGPLMWRSLRTGGLPLAKGIKASVSYTAFAGVPFLLQSSSMRFEQNLIVSALRNNELVFSRGFVTHGVYIDHDGKTHTLRAFDPNDPDESFRHINQQVLPADLPFIGLYHEDRGDGLGIVTLNRYVRNPESVVSPGDGGAHYYFNDGDIHRNKERNFTYFSRAEVFNRAWGEPWNSTIIKEGAVFAENSAFLVFPANTDSKGSHFRELENWTRQLRNPPRVWILDAYDWRKRIR